MKNKEKEKQQAPQQPQQDDTKLAIPRKNYRFIIIGMMVMAAGYILMLGGGSKDPNVFNYSMFSFTRTVLSPCLFVLGVVIIIIAIMRKPE
jgi:hypothetical protein